MPFGISRHFLKGWRTRIVAIAIFALGVLEAIDPYLISSLVGYEYRGYFILFIGLLMYLLREITTTPAGSEGNTESWFNTEDDPHEAPTEYKE